MSNLGSGVLRAGRGPKHLDDGTSSFAVQDGWSADFRSPHLKKMQVTTAQSLTVSLAYNSIVKSAFVIKPKRVFRKKDMYMPLLVTKSACTIVSFQALN